MRRQIDRLKKENADLQGKFDREISEYYDCFKLFKKDFKERPLLAWSFAKQFEHHLRQSMRQQGLEIGPRMGSGGFGVAYKSCRTRDTRNLLCVKVPIELKQESKWFISGSLEKEIRCLQAVHKFEGSEEADKVLDCIVKPIMPEVKLFNQEPVLVSRFYSSNLLRLMTCKQIEVVDLQWRHFFRRLFQAVKFLHSIDMVHRDLKPQNIMVELKEGPADERFSPVIIDFGFVNEKFGPRGTPGYVPPEAFEESPASVSKSQLAGFDVFALGSILFEIRFKRELPKVNKEPEEFKEALEVLAGCNDSLSRLIARLICGPSERLSITEALAHPWLNPTDRYKAAAILFDCVEDDEEMQQQEEQIQSSAKQKCIEQGGRNSS